MNPGGNVSTADRFFACLPYLLPLMDGVRSAIMLPGPQNSIFAQLPPLAALLQVLGPFMRIYFGIPFLGFILFLALYLLVVRNDAISHFIRFNTLQSILIGILVSLADLIVTYIFTPIGGFVVETLASTIFLGVAITVIYSVVQSVSGRYAEIPTLSDAVNMQIR